MKYFRFSFVPEEMVIPTIIFNSPYKANATIYKKGVYDGNKLTGNAFKFTKLDSSVGYNIGEELERLVSSTSSTGGRIILPSSLISSIVT